MSDQPSTLPVGGKIGNDDVRARNRAHEHFTDWATGDGAKVLFFLSKTPRDPSQLWVYVDGKRMRPNDRATAYDFALSGNRVTFAVAPAAGKAITFDQVSS